MSDPSTELLAKMHLTIPPLDEDIWYKPDGEDKRYAKVSDVAPTSFCVLSSNNVKTPVVCLQPWKDRHGSTLGVWAIPPTRANQNHWLIKHVSWNTSYNERFRTKYEKRQKQTKPPPETGDLFSGRS